MSDPNDPDHPDTEVQRYSQTSGRVLGVIGVVAAAVTAAMVLRSEEPSYATVAFCVFFGALAWAALLRPRLELGRSDLVLRNMLSTDTVPLAAVESVTVRQVLVVFAGDRRFTSPAVGRTRRQLVKDNFRGSGRGHGGMMGMLPAFPSSPEKPDNPKSSFGLFVEERVRSRVADALAREGIKARSGDQARLAEGITRRPAVVEILVLTSSLVAAVVLVVL